MDLLEGELESCELLLRAVELDARVFSFTRCSLGHLRELPSLIGRALLLS